MFSRTADGESRFGDDRLRSFLDGDCSDDMEDALVLILEDDVRSHNQWQPMSVDISIHCVQTSWATPLANLLVGCPVLRRLAPLLGFKSIDLVIDQNQAAIHLESFDGP